MPNATKPPVTISCQTLPRAQPHCVYAPLHTHTHTRGKIFKSPIMEQEVFFSISGACQRRLCCTHQSTRRFTSLEPQSESLQSQRHLSLHFIFSPRTHEISSCLQTLSPPQIPGAGFCNRFNISAPQRYNAVIRPDGQDCLLRTHSLHLNNGGVA